MRSSVLRLAAGFQQPPYRLLPGMGKAFERPGELPRLVGGLFLRILAQPQTNLRNFTDVVTFHKPELVSYFVVVEPACTN